jgi:hypothetical protein
MVLGSIVIGLGGILGRDGLSDYERTTGAGDSNADSHTGVVCRVDPWQGAR